MSKRTYTHIQLLLQSSYECKWLHSLRNCSPFGLNSKDVVKGLLERERKKERELLGVRVPHAKDRPSKHAPTTGIMAMQQDRIQLLFTTRNESS